MLSVSGAQCTLPCRRVEFGGGELRMMEEGSPKCGGRETREFRSTSFDKNGSKLLPLTLIDYFLISFSPFWHCLALSGMKYLTDLSDH